MNGVFSAMDVKVVANVARTQLVVVVAKAPTTQAISHFFLKHLFVPIAIHVELYYITDTMIL